MRFNRQANTQRQSPAIIDHRALLDRVFNDNSMVLRISRLSTYHAMKVFVTMHIRPANTLFHICPYRKLEKAHCATETVGPWPKGKIRGE